MSFFNLSYSLNNMQEEQMDDFYSEERLSTYSNEQNYPSEAQDIRRARQNVPKNTLDYLIYTSMIKEVKYPLQRYQVISDFVNGFRSLSKGQKDDELGLERFLREKSIHMYEGVTMNIIMNMVHKINLWKLNSLVMEAQISARVGKGKDMIIITGPTEAGKSTFIQYVLGYQHKKHPKKRTHLILDGELRPEHKSLETSPDPQSCTKMFNCYKIESQDEILYITDTAGQGDNRSVQIQITNFLSIEALLMEANSFRIIFMMSEINIGEKSKGLRDHMAQFSNRFGNFSQIKHKIIFVFNNFREQKLNDLPLNLENILDDSITRNLIENEGYTNLKELIERMILVTKQLEEWEQGKPITHENLVVFFPRSQNRQKEREKILTKITNPLYKIQNLLTNKNNNFSSSCQPIVTQETNKLEKKAINSLEQEDYDRAKYHLKMLEIFSNNLTKEKILEKEITEKNHAHQVWEKIIRDCKSKYDEFYQALIEQFVEIKQQMDFNTRDLEDLKEKIDKFSRMTDFLSEIRKEEIDKTESIMEEIKQCEEFLINKFKEKPSKNIWEKIKIFSRVFNPELFQQMKRVSNQMFESCLNKIEGHIFTETFDQLDSQLLKASMINQIDCDNNEKYSEMIQKIDQKLNQLKVRCEGLSEFEGAGMRVKFADSEIGEKINKYQQIIGRRWKSREMREIVVIKLERIIQYFEGAIRDEIIRILTDRQIVSQRRFIIAWDNYEYLKQISMPGFRRIVQTIQSKLIQLEQNFEEFYLNDRENDKSFEEYYTDMVYVSTRLMILRERTEFENSRIWRIWEKLFPQVLEKVKGKYIDQIQINIESMDEVDIEEINKKAEKNEKIRKDMEKLIRKLSEQEKEMCRDFIKKIFQNKEKVKISISSYYNGTIGRYTSNQNPLEEIVIIKGLNIQIMEIKKVLSKIKDLEIKQQLKRTKENAKEKVQQIFANIVQQKKEITQRWVQDLKITKSEVQTIMRICENFKEFQGSCEEIKQILRKKFLVELDGVEYFFSEIKKVMKKFLETFQDFFNEKKFNEIQNLMQEFKVFTQLQLCFASLKIKNSYKSIEERLKEMINSDFKDNKCYIIGDEFINFQVLEQELSKAENLKQTEKKNSIYQSLQAHFQTRWDKNKNECQVFQNLSIEEMINRNEQLGGLFEKLICLSLDMKRAKLESYKYVNGIQRLLSNLRTIVIKETKFIAKLINQDFKYREASAFLTNYKIIEQTLSNAEFEDYFQGEFLDKINIDRSYREILSSKMEEENEKYEEEKRRNFQTINWRNYSPEKRKLFEEEISEEINEFVDQIDLKQGIQLMDKPEIQKQASLILEKVKRCPNQSERQRWERQINETKKLIVEKIREEKENVGQYISNNKHNVDALIDKFNQTNQSNLKQEYLISIKSFIIQELNEESKRHFSDFSEFLRNSFKDNMSRISAMNEQQNFDDLLTIVERKMKNIFQQKLQEGKKTINRPIMEDEELDEGPFDQLRSYFEWVDENFEIMSPNFPQIMIQVLKKCQTNHQRIGKLIMNNPKDIRKDLWLSIMSKIKHLLDWSPQSKFGERVLSRLEGDTQAIENKILEKINEEKSDQEFMKKVSFFTPEFVQISKEQKQKILEQVFEISKKINYGKDDQRLSRQRICRSINVLIDSFSKLEKELAIQLQSGTNFFSQNLYQIGQPLEDNYRTVFDIIDICAQKSMKIFPNLSTSFTTFKRTFYSSFQKIYQKLQNAIKQVNSESVFYFDIQRKVQDEKTVKIQKLKKSLDERIKQFENQSKLRQQAEILALKGTQFQIEQVEKLQNKFAGMKIDKINGFENEVSEKMRVIERDLDERKSKEIRKLKQKIEIFVHWSLVLQKIFSEVMMPKEEMKFRKKIEDLNQIFKKKVIKIVFQAASKSDYKTYGQSFLDKNKIFEQGNYALWKLKTQHVGIKEVIQNLGVNRSIRESLDKSYNVYKEQFNIWTERYKKRPNQDEENSLIEQIKQDGKNLSECYSKNKTSMSWACEKLLGKIFALMAILKVDIDEENCSVAFEYEPHPAQIVSILLLLNEKNHAKVKKINNAMAQIQTGQGKSVVLGGLCSYLGVCGFNVFCVCYSSYLSERDNEQFCQLFSKLQLQKKIKYGTFQKLAETKLKSIRQVMKKIIVSQSDESGFLNKIWKKITSSLEIKNLINSDPNQILLIDEVDVFFDEEYYGSMYKDAISINGKQVQNFLKSAWRSPNSIESSKEFKVLVERYPNITKLLKKQFIPEFKYELEKFDYGSYSKKYRIIDGKICYRSKDNYSSQITQGFRTMIAYLEQSKRNLISPRILSEVLEISIVFAQFSYAQLPKLFGNILGVTGTLEYLSITKSDELRNRYNVEDLNKFIIPSVYADSSKRRKVERKVVDISAHEKEILREIEDKHTKGRPVLVFFKDQANLMKLFTSPEYSHLSRKTQILDESFNAFERNKKIRDTGNVAQITLMTDSFSRGTDFKISEKAVQLGGLHVIQTYICQEFSDQIQAQGRTARKDEPGSYICLITPSHLELLGLDGRQNINENTIYEARLKVSESSGAQVLSKVDQARRRHEETKKFMNEEKNVEKILQKILDLNRFNFSVGKKCSKIVLGIDGTCSMTSALSHVVSILSESLNNLYKLLKDSKCKSTFELKIIIYRNYNSSKNKIIEETNFQIKMEILQQFLKNVKVDGGWGNQALEMLYSTVNKSHNKSPISELIILGDAAANTRAETDWKRSEYAKDYSKETLCYEEEEFQKIKLSGIKVHSFYIKTDHGDRYFDNEVKPYFKKISQETKGISELFNVTAPDASSKLRRFLVQRIIESTAENEKDAENLKEEYKRRYVSR